MTTRNAVTTLLDKLAKVKNLTPKRATTSSDLASSRSVQLAACIAETSKLQQRLMEAYGTVLIEAQTQYYCTEIVNAYFYQGLVYSGAEHVQ